MSAAAATDSDGIGFDFDNIINFRDVGQTVNEFLGSKVVREGMLFRSARPDNASLRDRERLREELGIRTVMDLRTKTEHLQQAKKRQADRKIPALLQSNAALAEPVQIPELTYVHVSITGRGLERHIVKQLSWWNLLKFLILYIFGLRIMAIRIIGREVMLRRGLIGMAVDVLDHSQHEVVEALGTFVDPGKGLPALVHCTQGKDRTGIVVSLALMILGVPLQAIAHDYALSDQGLVSEVQDHLREIHRIGLSDDFAYVAPHFNVEVVRYLDDAYGGLEAYLDRIGFVQHDRERLRELLLY